MQDKTPSFKWYDQEVLSEINNSVNIVDYAATVFELHETSGNFYAKCPFHEDKTPSLCFSPARNMYHCFSCGASGGIIRFLMDFEGLKFPNAVLKASEIADMDLSKLCSSNTIRYLKDRRQKKSTAPKEVEHDILDERILDNYEKSAPQVWIDEGISPEVMRIFDIRYDELGNRIVYPVRNADGQLINIKGRTLYENYKQLKLSKYMNYFKIGVMDYFQSYDITKDFIKEKNEIIIFESIKSTMKAFGWGYKNCVSAEKHNLTEEQLRFLVKLHCDIVFAYDSDISYSSKDIKKDLDRLKRITNVFVIDDKNKLLGGAETKNAPVDCGKEVWERLYSERRKVI